MIYKDPGIYKRSVLYKEASIYNGDGLYKNGSKKIPNGLMTLFYGDFNDGNYNFRYYDDTKIFQVTPNAGGNTTSYAITETRYENTPLGNIPIFKYGDPDNTYYLMGYFNPDAFLFGSFTTDFWFYCKPSDYSLYGINRFIASQLRIRSIDNASTKNVNFGPYDNVGVYYNLTDGAVDTNLTTMSINNWHHIEVDFDYTNKIMTFYIDGVKYIDINVSNTPLYTYFKNYDYFHASRVTNDSRNHVNVKITQLALWNKLMNGTCYGMGLYHDGNKFLI